MGEVGGEMYALAAVLTVVALMAVILRLCARNIGSNCLNGDDYVIMIALVNHHNDFGKCKNRRC
jgi:hypothetical protein